MSFYRSPLRCYVVMLGTNVKVEIAETVTRYFHALDARDWEKIAVLVDDPIAVVHGSHEMSLADDEFVSETERIFSELDATQNHLGPIVVESSTEDQATARFQMRTTFIRHEAAEGPIYVIGARYTVGLERSDGMWKIHSIGLDETYDEGNQELRGSAH